MRLGEMKEQERFLLKKLTHLKKTDFETPRAFYEEKKKLSEAHVHATQARVLAEQEAEDAKREATIQETKNLIISKLQLLRVTANNRPVQIDPKNFTITVQFAGCTHTHTYTLDELIPFATQQRLWQDITEGLALEMGRNCQECFKERNENKAKWGRHTDRPVGHVNFLIRGLS